MEWRNNIESVPDELLFSMEWRNNIESVPE